MCGIRLVNFVPYLYEVEVEKGTSRRIRGKSEYPSCPWIFRPLPEGGFLDHLLHLQHISLKVFLDGSGERKHTDKHTNGQTDATKCIISLALRSIMILGNLERKYTRNHHVPFDMFERMSFTNHVIIVQLTGREFS